MGPSNLWWAQILMFIYFYSKFMILWWPNNRQFLDVLDGGLSSSHVKSTNPSSPSRVVYGNAYLKSLGKTQKKQVLSKELWQKLGSLGIRKPFRSNRRKRPSITAGHPVGILPQPEVSSPHGRDGLDTPRTVPVKSSIPNILICNLRSLSPKIDELDCVMEHNDVDIACITETWLTDEIPESQVSLKDFTLFRKDRPTRAGGIAAYIRSCIPCVRLLEAELTGAVTETMWLNVKPFRLLRSVSTILIGIIYHPPHASADDNNMLYSHVQETVDRFLRSHPEALVCVTGDFNPPSTRISPVSFKRISGLTLIVKVLTRDTGTLDWCLTNNAKLLKVPKQIPKIGLSDHYGVLVQQAPPTQKCGYHTIIKRDTRDSALRGFGRWITYIFLA